MPFLGYSMSRTFLKDWLESENTISAKFFAAEYTARITGIRSSNDSHPPTNARPTKLAVSAPVTSSTTTARITPRPGDVKSQNFFRTKLLRQQQKSVVGQINSDVHQRCGNTERHPNQDASDKIATQPLQAEVALVSELFLVSVFLAGASQLSFLLSDFVDVDSLSLAILRLSPVLKSVSYQPLPLSRNLGADSCFFSEASPHSGQSSNLGSLIFCSASNR